MNFSSTLRWKSTGSPFSCASAEKGDPGSNLNHRCRSAFRTNCKRRDSRCQNRLAPTNCSVRYCCTQQYSITALTDSSGTIKERYAYDAYGNLFIFDGAGASRSATAEGNRYTYTGREWDEALEIYHYRRRPFGSRSGRFCSRDPIGFRGSKWNLFGYVKGMPTVRVDPHGLDDTAILHICRDKDPCEEFHKWLKGQPPRIHNLIECARKRGCVGEVTCSKGIFWNACTGSKMGAYRPGNFWGGTIYLCYNTFQEYPLERERTLLEELYHSLTLCPNGSSLGTALANLRTTLESSFLSPSQKVCGVCMGNEMLAKACVTPNVGFDMLVTRAEASCDCDDDVISPDYSSTPLGSILANWWSLGMAANDCRSINQECGAN